MTKLQHVRQKDKRTADRIDSLAGTDNLQSRMKDVYKRQPEGLPFFIPSCGEMNVFGISSRFQLLSPSEGQVAYALLTRLPLELIRSKLLISSRSTCMC